MRLIPLAAIDDARADWDRLAAAGGNFFLTPEWAETWWRHYGEGRRLLLYGCVRDGAQEPFALLPLHLETRGPIRVLRFIGHGPADELGPVCAPGDRADAAQCLQLAIAEQGRGCAGLLGDNMAAEPGWDRLLGGRVLRSEPSPVLSFGGLGWDEFLASRSRNFRDQVRRRERKLAKSRELSYRLCDDPDRLAGDMETLFRLHEARWGSEGSGAFDPRRRAFHLDFAALALERGWLRLWMLELDGAPAAAWYGFRFGDAECFYQSGRDPALEREAVGFVLMAHTVREAMGSGAAEYRLLRGGESYKDRFSNEERSVDTLLVPRGLIGRIGAGAAKLPPAQRRRVGRAARALLGRGRT